MPTPLVYHHILNRAWMITKKYKALWFFGLFAAPVMNGGVLELLYRSVILSPLPDGNVFKSIAQVFSHLGIMAYITSLMGAASSSSSPTFPSVLLSIVVLAAGAFLFWLMVASLDGLITGARLGLKNTSFSIKEGLRQGRSSFWPLSFTLLGGALLVSVLFTLLRALFSMTTTNPVATGLVVLGILCLILLLIVVYFSTFYMVAGLIVKRSDWRQALQEGVQLTRTHWLVSLELSIVLFVSTLLIGLFAFFVIFLFIGLPLYYMLYVAAVGFLWDVPFASYALLLLFLYALVLGVWGILSAFQAVAWVSLYTQIQKKVAVQSHAIHMSHLIRSMIRGPEPHQTNSL